MLGWPEIVGIVLIVLLLFGAKKVPEVMKGLALGVREFKKASREVLDTIEGAPESPPPSRPQVPVAPSADRRGPSGPPPVSGA